MAAAFVGLLLLSRTEVHGTLVRPTSFGELVAKADLIFTGKVLSHQSRWVNQDIVTDISFEVFEVHKGRAKSPLTLRFMGGTVGDVTLEVIDMPQFKVGETAILFVRAQASASCPIVGIYHGKLSLQKDGASGPERLVRHNGSILTDLAEIGSESPARAAAPGAAALRRPLTLEDFKAGIRRQLGNSGAGQSTNPPAPAKPTP